MAKLDRDFGFAEEQPDGCEAMTVGPVDEAVDASDDDENGPHDESAASGANAAGRKRRRGRRNRKAGEHHPSSGRRPYKPYTKMSWEERKQVDERETSRANRRREQQIAAGQAMAPYNTTQFLMEQHEPIGPSGDIQSFLSVVDKDSSGAGGRSSGSITGESSAPDLDDGLEDMFLEKEFSEAYDNFHAERLQMLSKDEMIREYVQMEAKLERLQHGREEPAGEMVTRSTSAELQSLRDENCRLTKENERLRNELSGVRSTRYSPDAASSGCIR